MKEQSNIQSDWYNITRNKKGCSKKVTINTFYSVLTVDISPDGQFIASAGSAWGDYPIQIWDPNTAKQVGFNLKGHTDSIHSIKYSPCGKYIVSCSRDQTIRQWSTTTYQQIGQPIMGHKEFICKAQYSFNQMFIISCSIDSTIRIWNTRTQKEQVDKRIINHQSICCLALSQSTRQVAYGDSRGKIYFSDYGKHKICRYIKADQQKIYQISYSSNCKMIVSSGMNMTIKIWDVLTNKELGCLVGHINHYISSVNFSRDMKLIISGGDDNTVRIWDRFTTKQIGKNILHHKSFVNLAFFSVDGKYIITGSVDRTIKIMLTPIQ